MAMVLVAFESYLQKILMDMAKDKVVMMLGVSKEIVKLAENIGDLQNILTDADRRNITDQSVQSWVRDLKHVMYEATNILDLCQLKSPEQGTSPTNVGCFTPLLSCLRNPLHAHDIGSRIAAINQSLESIKVRSARFEFISHQVHTSPARDVRSETSGLLVRSSVVGEKIKEDTKKLVELMVTENEDGSNIVVVAIVGVGGIGKTTLAQNIFNDEDINSMFDKKIWLSINRDFDIDEVLRTTITIAGGDHRGEKALAVLEPVLAACLRGEKVLLVMDDVWTDEAWGVLHKTFFNVVAQGSRVLVTTRDETVAQRMKALVPYHRIAKFDDEDAWLLLCKQVTSSEKEINEIDKSKKKIGLKIIAKCDGLPLAVKVMGGLLCQRGKKPCEWQSVFDDLMHWAPRINKELNSAIYLSYEDLPPYLKQCFLHYSLIPDNSEFYSGQIIGMWISEGFVHGDQSDKLEQLGEQYYEELISRNLIEPEPRYADTWYCKMHGIIRSFAQYVARDEALVAHSGGIVNTKHKLLRLSMENKAFESDESQRSFLKEQKSLRTLISIGNLKIRSRDLLTNFSSIRTLHLQYSEVSALVESICQLKHLRYLSIQYSDLSAISEDIGKMRFLQHLSLRGCRNLIRLPPGIVNLEQLRYLSITSTNINVIPKAFRSLKNLRTLRGFPSHVDGDWCSLEELAPLTKLRNLVLKDLENVSTTPSAAETREDGLESLENVSAKSFAAKANLGAKMQLKSVNLRCTSRLGDDGLVTGGVVSADEQRRIKEVFDELSPPNYLYFLKIDGYFGLLLPSWMMSPSTAAYENLRILGMADLACCTQLPDGLSQLPSLQQLQINRAPAIKHVGSEFLQLYRSHNSYSFKALERMNLMGMVKWEEWEWVEEIEAMPFLQELLLRNCKLRRLPPGLASNARALKKMCIKHVRLLSYIENFSSVVELIVAENPELEIITNLRNLQKITIVNCPKLKVLEEVGALQRIILEDYGMTTLPEYMPHVKPRHLDLRCSLAMLVSIADLQSGSQWNKFGHVEHVKAYARDGENTRKWYVLYTKESCVSDTNTSRSFFSRGTSLFSMVDVQGFESVLKMRRTIFNYICCLLSDESDDMTVLDSGFTFADGRMLCSKEDRVAIALIVLNSDLPLGKVPSSIGLDELTVSLVTKSFVEAMVQRAAHHLRWPGSESMEKIKSKFDLVHGLPNCCGVVHTTDIPFGPNSDHENNYGMLLQILVDPDMRFTNIWLGPSDRMDQLSLFHDSPLFKRCEKGELLNGMMLQLFNESEIGEYVIGDVGYSLLPWLLTPYQKDDQLMESEVEFNRRHSAARTIALKAMKRFKDTWKGLRGGICDPNNPSELFHTIYVCCMLHNIAIDMDEARIERDNEVNSTRKLRQLAEEDAVKVRDILSQHLTSRPFVPSI